MLRRTLAHLLVLAAFAALDVLLVTIGYFNLYLIRISREFSLIFQWRKVFSYDYLSSLAYFEGYLKFYFVIVVVLVFLLQKYGLYYLGVREGALDEFFKVSKAVLYSGLVVAFLSYLFKVQLFSRFVFAAFIAVSIIVLWLWRMVKLQITLSLFQRGFLQKKLLIIGAGEVGQMVAEEIRSRPGLGYRIAGFVDDDPEKMSRTVAGVEVVSTSRDIQEAVTRTGAEEILITIPSERELTNSIISQIRRYNLQIRIVPEMFNLMTTSVEVGRLGPVPYMRIVKTPMRGMPLFVKRLFDVTVSLTGLLFVSPIFLAVVTAIKLDSPGPVIFKQKRVGKNGDLFDFYNRYGS